jgi:hypothetical protein
MPPGWFRTGQGAIGVSYRQAVQFVFHVSILRQYAVLCQALFAFKRALFSMAASRAVFAGEGGWRSVSR